MQGNKILFLIFSINEKNILSKWKHSGVKFNQLCTVMFSRPEYENIAHFINPNLLHQFGRKVQWTKIVFEKRSTLEQLRERLLHRLESQSELKLPQIYVDVHAYSCEGIIKITNTDNFGPFRITRGLEEHSVIILEPVKYEVYYPREYVTFLSENTILKINEYY